MKESKYVLLCREEDKAVGLCISLGERLFNLTDFVYGLNFKYIMDHDAIVVNSQVVSYKLISEEEAISQIKKHIPTMFLRHQDLEFFDSEFCIPTKDDFDEIFSIMKKKYNFDEMMIDYLKVRMNGLSKKDDIVKALGISPLEYFAFNFPSDISEISNLSYYKLLLESEGYIVKSGWTTVNGETIYTLRDNPQAVIKLQN